MTPCPACAARDLRIRDLQAVIAKLQLEAKRKMGRRAVAIIEVLDGGKRLTPVEVAKLTKDSSIATRTLMNKLASKGLLRRVGWRDVLGRRWPEPEFEIASARDGNGAA